MLFQMTADWNVGNGRYPAGETYDGNSLPWPLPLTVRAMDQEALNVLSSFFHEDLWDQLQYANGLRLPDPRHPPLPPLRKIPPSEASEAPEPADAVSAPTFPRRI